MIYHSISISTQPSQLYVHVDRYPFSDPRFEISCTFYSLNAEMIGLCEKSISDCANNHVHHRRSALRNNSALVGICNNQTNRLGRTRNINTDLIQFRCVEDVLDVLDTRERQRILQRTQKLDMRG